jgi:hypothetical protein
MTKRRNNFPKFYSALLGGMNRAAEATPAVVRGEGGFRRVLALGCLFGARRLECINSICRLNIGSTPANHASFSNGKISRMRSPTWI